MYTRKAYATRETPRRRGRLAIRCGFTPTDCERVTVPQHDFGGMQHVCGIKSRGRAIARRGDHEPDEQMNGPAHGGRRHAKEVCRQLKELRQSNGGSNLRLVRYGIVSGAGKAVTA